jgi:hypothetical protein
MTKRVLMVLLALLVFASVASPVFAADEVALEVFNKTQSTVNLVLNGPTDMKVSISRAFTVLRLEPGLYNYRYKACGVNRTGTFTLSSTGGTFTLKKCEKDLNGNINITNLTGSPFILRLSGPRNYNLTIKPGVNRLTLQAGRYGYSASICGSTETGSHAIKSGKKNPDWVFEDCD